MWFQFFPYILWLNILHNATTYIKKSISYFFSFFLFFFFFFFFLFSFFFFFFLFPWNFTIKMIKGIQYIKLITTYDDEGFEVSFCVEDEIESCGKNEYRVRRPTWMQISFMNLIKGSVMLQRTRLSSKIRLLEFKGALFLEP